MGYLDERDTCPDLVNVYQLEVKSTTYIQARCHVCLSLCSVHTTFPIFKIKYFRFFTLTSVLIVIQTLNKWLSLRNRLWGEIDLNEFDKHAFSPSIRDIQSNLP